MTRKLLALAGLAIVFEAIAADATLLMEEKFEDLNFGTRGWYDGSGPVLTTVEHIPGSTKSAEYRWEVGKTSPVGAGAFRHKFTASDAIYVSYWVKYSTNYTGSNRPYHPHEFNLLTTKNTDYWGPAYSHLTGYIEQNEGKPMLLLQDGQNIDETKIGVDLTGVTESRAVAGCNGSYQDGYANMDCYQSGNVHWNGKAWKASEVYFKDTPGANYKADWHRVEAYFKMNSIANAKGVPDGVLRYWMDGALLIESTNVVMRTAVNADMKWNQLLIAPYIGDGSPVAQTMWIDDVRISTTRFLADFDKDRMGDDWELQRGLDPLQAADALEDADGDGFNNVSEFLAGTDPRDAGSLLRISDATVGSANFTIHFNSVAGKNYQLERANILGGVGWFPIGTNVPGNGGMVEISDFDERNDAARFYRLKL